MLQPSTFPLSSGCFQICVRSKSENWYNEIGASSHNKYLLLYEFMCVYLGQIIISFQDQTIEQVDNMKQTTAKEANKRIALGSKKYWSVKVIRNRYTKSTELRLN